MIHRLSIHNITLTPVLRVTSIKAIRRAGLERPTIAKITVRKSLKNLIEFYNLNLEVTAITLFPFSDKWHSCRCVCLLQFSPTPQGKGLAEVCSAIGRGPQIGQGKKVEKVSLKRKMVDCDEKSEEALTSDSKASEASASDSKASEALASDSKASKAVASDSIASKAVASHGKVVASPRVTVPDTSLAVTPPSTSNEFPASPVQASSPPQLFSSQFSQPFPNQFSQPFSTQLTQP